LTAPRAQEANPRLFPDIIPWPLRAKPTELQCARYRAALLHLATLCYGPTKMDNKQALLTQLRDEFREWEDRLASMSDEQVNTLLPGSTWSVKDVLAHLRAWQQISIARVEAAFLGEEPGFPAWLAGTDPFEADTDENRDDFNARIYSEYHERSWSSVCKDWSQGFQRFMHLAAELADDQLFDSERYPWLNGYPLSAVLEGSCEHHHEHLADLTSLGRADAIA
jgi:hypothetical protein